MKQFLALLVFLMLAPPASGIEADCPWKLRLLLGDHVAKKMDPADVAALESILQGAYHRPEIRTSRAEDFWLEEYGLGEAADYLRSQGRQKNQAAQKQTWRRRYAVALGVALSAGFLGILSRPGEQPESPLVAELNEQYGLNLVDANRFADPAVEQERLEYLKAVLECNPMAPKDEPYDMALALKRGGKHRLTTGPDLAQQRTALRLLEYLWSGDPDNNPTWTYCKSPLLVRYAAANPLSKDVLIGRLLIQAWREHGVIFCGLWGNPQSELWSFMAINRSLALLNALRPPSSPPTPLRLVAARRLDSDPRGAMVPGPQGTQLFFVSDSEDRMVDVLAERKAQELYESWTPAIRWEWNHLSLEQNRHAAASAPYSGLKKYILALTQSNPGDTSPELPLDELDPKFRKFAETHILAPTRYLVPEEKK